MIAFAKDNPVNCLLSAGVNGRRLEIRFRLRSGERASIEGSRKTMASIARAILQAAGEAEGLRETEDDFLRALHRWRTGCGYGSALEKNQRDSQRIVCDRLGVNYHKFRAWLPGYEAFEAQACDQRIICALCRSAA